MENDHEIVLGPDTLKMDMVCYGTKGYREPEKVFRVSHNYNHEWIKWGSWAFS
jgi:hypothetical protein